MMVEPPPDGPECGMFEIALKIARDARDMTQILVLAVAAGESCEYPEDLGCALGAEDRQGESQFLLVEPGLAAPAGAIVLEQPIGGLARRVDPRILKERHEVIGRMAENAVLGIDETDPCQPFAIREPDEVGRMIV